MSSNRTYEAYQRTVNGATEYLQNSSITYDELNRVSQITDPRATIRYEYDAVGNRRHVWSYYNNGLDGNISTQDYWYSFDSMNRFTVTMGQLSTGARATSANDTSVSIVAGASGSGVSLSYNLAGERKSATYANDGHTESYDFDATGHLTNTYITLKGASSRYLAAARSNDLLGRMTGYTEYNADGSQKFWRTSTYDADSRVIAQNGSDGSTTYNFYASKTATGADNTANVSQSGFGEVAQVVTVGTGPSSNTTTTTTWTSYQYWDDAKEIGKTISGYNPVLEGNNGQWAPGVSSLKYDVNGHLVSATDAGKDGTVGTADDIRFAYITNAQGVVLRRDQYYGSSVAKTRSYYYLNGQAVGDVGNDGDTLKDYAQTLSQAKVSKEQSYKNWTPISSADFDQNWQPVGPSYPGDAAGSYTVKAGDTLQSIAQNIWGDASLWYVLADANGVSGSTALKAGQVLTLPNRITNIHNNSTTFRPYNAGRVIGDTSPTLPDAPPAPVHSSGGGGGCGGGGILVAIVVVAVAVVTMQPEFIPAAIAEMGTTATVMYSAAAANVAGQVAGNAVGTQDGFSWSSLAVSVGTAGIMSELNVASQLGVSSQVGSAMLNAAAANAVNQSLNMALGKQNGFNWTSLAISAVAAPIANQISSGFTGQGGTFANADALTQNAINGGTRALVSAVTRLSIQGGKLNWEAVAADTIYAMQEGLRDQYRNSTGTTGADGQQASSDQSQERVANAQEELRFKLGEGVAQVNQGNASVYGHGIQLADAGTTMSDVGLSPTQEALNHLASDNATASRTIPDKIASDSEKLALYSKVLSMTGKTSDDAEAIANAIDVRRSANLLIDRLATMEPTAPEYVNTQKTLSIMTNALISKDSYFDTSLSEILPNGVTRMSDPALSSAGLKFTNADFRDDESGYFGALYQNNNTVNQTPAYIFANRGTESGGAGIKDWMTNGSQSLGFRDAQFDQAINLASSLEKQLGSNVSFTGHSLGGGLAAAQAMAVNGHAATFNAEGVSDGTIRRYDLSTEGVNQRITAFYVNGEVLSRLQDNPLSSALTLSIGTVPKNLAAVGGMVSDLWNDRPVDTSRIGLPIIASAPGTRIELPAVSLEGTPLGPVDRLTNSVSLHFMDYALKSIQTQLRPDGTLPSNYLKGVR
jgi:YD repeat-containing protein